VVACYPPVVVTPQVLVKLTDGVSHTVVNVVLDKKKKTLDVALVKDAHFYRLAIETE
jgi:hypothetical protein